MAFFSLQPPIGPPYCSQLPIGTPNFCNPCSTATIVITSGQWRIQAPISEGGRATTEEPQANRGVLRFFVLFCHIFVCSKIQKTLDKNISILCLAFYKNGKTKQRSQSRNKFGLTQVYLGFNFATSSRMYCRQNKLHYRALGSATITKLSLASVVTSGIPLVFRQSLHIC